MEFYRITTATEPYFQEAFALYESSFPNYQRRDKEVQIETLAQQDYHFEVILEGETMIGIRLYWETSAFLYLEHYAIVESLQGKGYGTKALEDLDKKEKAILLEIDPPVNFDTGKRKFYCEEQGFFAQDYYHIHPPYRMGFDGHRLIIMAKPSITKEQYDTFFDYLQGRVMCCSDFGDHWIIW